MSATLTYLLVRGRQDDTLFWFWDDKPLTRLRFVSTVRGALVKAGIQAQLYAGHSFRIVAATTAAARGMEDSVIRTMGRWKSLAYLEHIKIPRQQLAHVFSHAVLMSVYCVILAITGPSFGLYCPPLFMCLSCSRPP